MKNSGVFKKYARLKNILKDLDSTAVAFSGGLDSSFLLKAAKEVLGERVIAVTAKSPVIPVWELKEAKIISRSMNVKHIIVTTDEFKDKKFIANTRLRCYWCKKEMIRRLYEALNLGPVKNIIDGTTFDDINDYRPGLKANKKYGIRSPLAEAKLSKAEIRFLARYYKLSFWDKPSTTCLASRIPFGEKITLEKIKKVEKAEGVLRKFLGSKMLLRLRGHKNIARLEFARNGISSVLKKKGWRDVVKKIKAIGYKYVVIDLEGYKPAGRI